MKKILTLIVVFFLSTLHSSSLLEELNSMTLKQYLVFTKIYRDTKDSNYTFTIMAIAWQESQVGKYPINLDDPSFGIFHIVPKSKGWDRSREAEKLLNFDYSIKRVKEEIYYWHKYHKGTWKNVVKSYNAGFNYNSSQAEKYLKAISSKVKLLKNIIKDNID